LYNLKIENFDRHFQSHPEAKGELKKRIERDKLDLRVHSVETTDKMTEPQILQKVRSHYFPLPKRRQAAVFPH